VAQSKHPIRARAGAERQSRTDAYFGDTTAYWHDVYLQGDLQGLVYRERMQTVLTWVDELFLSPGARVLEVGSGAGLATVELARRGFAVESSDSSADMVALASRKVAEAGLGDRVALHVADIHALPHETGSFDLVVALGVLPWLHSPDAAIRELARVLAPGGHAIVTADNRLRLNLLVEPRESPVLAPLKLLRQALRRRRSPGPPGPVSYLHTPLRVNRMLGDAGLVPERRATVGFGPFTFLGRGVLGDRAGWRLHRALQRLAARRFPGLAWAGWHYVVSARRE
jgi:SAM-dependent methyltransferase